MRLLKAQPLRPAYYDDVERQLLAAFYAIVFQPVFAVLKDASAQVAPAQKEVLAMAELANADDGPLRAALRSGRVQYKDGVFSGLFNRAIVDAMRAFGGRLDKPAKVYRADPAQVPAWVKAEAGAYEQAARRANEAVRRKLDEVQDRLDALVEQHPITADKTVDEVNAAFMKASEALEFIPELGAEARVRLARDYSTNMKLWVKNFSKDMITDLREGVEKNAMQGYRFDKLMADIKGRYGVSMSKARFLARQETSIFMSRFRRERFREVGVKRYIWSGSMDARERPDHKALEGQTFFYSRPPVVDRRTGRRGNPGEDFGCRCVDIPVVDEVPARVPAETAA